MPLPEGTIFVVGPTASGKTRFALDLAAKHNGEIINGDAYQVYKGLRILSAGPNEEELAQAPHHLFETLPPSEELNAALHYEAVKPIAEKLHSEGKTPIIVGGSGMYLKFMTHGSSGLPEGDETMRAAMDAQPLEELVAKLEERDPEGAAQTNLTNRRYVSRALEICLLTGQKMSELKVHWKKRSEEIDAKLQGYVLQWDRDTLADRIALRTSEIMKSGAIQEVETLRNIASNTCRKAIGFREIESYLDGEVSFERCEELILFATRQYAKRQRTWFRKEQWLKTVTF